MSCNVTQNEVGGKDLLLKVCKDVTVKTVDLSAELEVTAHGLKVGDLFKFKAIGALTVVDLATIYFVVEIVSANKFKIAATVGGAALIMDESEASLAAEAFINVGGIRSKSVSLASEAVDITSQDSDEWKTMLDGAGLRSGSISGSGVYTNAVAFGLVEDAFLANALLCLAFADVKGSKIIAGCYKVTSLEYSGDYNAEGNFSISAESSGALTVQKV